MAARPLAFLAQKVQQAARTVVAEAADAAESASKEVAVLKERLAVMTNRMGQMEQKAYLLELENRKALRALVKEVRAVTRAQKHMLGRRRIGHPDCAVNVAQPASCVRAAVAVRPLLAAHGGRGERAKGWQGKWMGFPRVYVGNVVTGTDLDQ